MQKVSLYTRHNSSRKYEKVSAKASFGKGVFLPGTIFVLRLSLSKTLSDLIF